MHFLLATAKYSARRIGRHELIHYSRILLSFCKENDKELKKTRLMMIMICCRRAARALPPTAEVRDTSYVIPAAITKHCVIIDLSKCHALMTSTVRIPLAHRSLSVTTVASASLSSVKCKVARARRLEK